MSDIDPFAEDGTFGKRGISKEIAEARPYMRWETDDLEPVIKAYSSLGKGSLRFALKIAKQEPGWLINRRPPEGFGLEDIYPEFRPDNPVKTRGKVWHKHSLTPPPAAVPWQKDPRVLSGQALEKHVKHGCGPVRTQDGSVVSIERKPKSPTDHPYPSDWMVRQDIHWHQPFAKYVFPTSPKVDEPYSHDHHAYWHDHKGHTDKWIAEHVAKDHHGSEQAWYGQPHSHPKVYGVEMTHASDSTAMGRHIISEHEGNDVVGLHGGHTRHRKDGTLNLARRIDVHPWAMERIPTAEVVFFVIEGCLKADAILAKGAAVFSVPSVSLWDCLELKDFTETYLKDKEVVIIPDADWAANPQVWSQARLCHATLNRYGVARVHIAAPPVDDHRNPTRGKGVDDFLGNEGHGELAELQTLDWCIMPETRKAIEHLLERCSRSDQYDRNCKVLESLAIFTGPSGKLPSSLGMVARAMGVSYEKVERGLKDLKKWGAVDYGELKQRRNYWTGKLDWLAVDPIIIAEDYRAQEDERKVLGDAVYGSLTNGGT